MKNKHLCVVGDLEKAFDIVWKNGLWNKLFKSEINEKWFDYLSNMLTVYGSLIKDYYEWCTLKFFSCKCVSIVIICIH